MTATELSLSKLVQCAESLPREHPVETFQEKVLRFSTLSFLMASVTFSAFRHHGDNTRRSFLEYGV